MPPLVLGPLSVCGAHVEVQGQDTGSSVTLVANGQPVGNARATRADHSIDLDAGVQLAPHAKATATQADAGETSTQSPQPAGERDDNLSDGASTWRTAF